MFQKKKNKWVRITTDHKCFFAHIHWSTNPFLSKIDPKTWFLPFSKQWKMWYPTPIFEFLKNGYYEFCSVPRFGLKQSIAIFCTTWNRFWTRFDWFRQDWKSRVLDENQCFFRKFCPYNFHQNKKINSCINAENIKKSWKSTFFDKKVWKFTICNSDYFSCISPILEPIKTKPFQTFLSKFLRIFSILKYW